MQLVHNSYVSFLHKEKWYIVIIITWYRIMEILYVLIIFPIIFILQYSDHTVYIIL